MKNNLFFMAQEYKISQTVAAKVAEFFSMRLFDSVMMKAADVNNDGEVNAIDASLVLAYYAHISTGGTLSLKDFISDKV